jgi:hypothetical protein
LASQALQIAQLVSSFAAACGLFLTGWQLIRTRRVADLQALQKFFESANAQEAALANETDQRKKVHAFYEFLNFLEVYAAAHNKRLFARGSEEMVRHKLEDSCIELEQSPSWHQEIEKASDRATTFAELRKFIGKHPKEINDRRAQRALFMQQQAASAPAPTAQ